MKVLRLVETIPFLLTPVCFYILLLALLCMYIETKRWTFYPNHVASMGTSLASVVCACDVQNVYKLAGLLPRS